MSRSPSEAEDAGVQTIGKYFDAWNDLSVLIRSGRSFSGHERNCAFLNTGGKRFATISAASGLDYDDDARGLATVDWDFDGDLDLWLSNRTAPRLRMMRNDIGDQHHFIALRLRGVQCNRDAIGARIEVHTDEQLQIRTLAAGDAFLSQSSKWLHVGLGDAERVDKLVVRWPGGEPQTFTDVAGDRFYRLTQGETLVEWTPPRRGSPATAGEQQPHEPTQQSRIRPLTRAPMPDLAWKDMDGETQRLDDIDKPVLINLWASWCAPCKTEMRAFIAHGEQFDAVGLDVVALSVDGLSQGYDTDRKDVVAFLDQLDWPMASGMASATLLDKLQTLHGGYVFRTLDAFPVPTSFLVDRQGRVAVMYLGPVDVEQLMQDVASLDDESDPRRFAAPLDGRWLFPVQGDRFAALARRFAQAGYGDDMMRYLNAMEQTSRGLVDQDLIQNLLTLGDTLMKQDKPAEAIKQYQAALAHQEDNPFSHYSLAMALRRVGRTEQAIEHLSRTVALSSDTAPPRRELAEALIGAGRFNEAVPHLDWLASHGQQQRASRMYSNMAVRLYQQGERDDAVRYLQRAREINPANLAAIVGLSTVRDAQGRSDQAITLLEDAIAEHPDQPVLHRAVGILLRKHGQAKPAAEHLNEALRLNPQDINLARELAWTIATSNAEGLHPIDQVIDMAERMAEHTEHRDARVLDTLAAAYAKAGRFDEAAQTAERALDVTAEPLRSQIADRLELYRAGEMYLLHSEQ